MTDYKDIAKMNDADLTKFVAEKREEIRKFRFGVAGAGTRNVRAIRAARKEVARALTELTKRRTDANNVTS